MLTNNQISQIREHLEKSQNPLFFFDNDTDGLCAFLVLQKYIGRGKGVPIKGFPESGLNYIRKINEFNSDCIFILDKPFIPTDLLEEVHRLNIPVVWIDHHEIDKTLVPGFVNYYNPVFNKDKNNEPTTYLCYQVSQKKEDLWLATIGSVSDGFVPEYYEEFLKNYPDLAIDSGTAFDITYKSQIGRIIKLFSFGLKDRTTNVVNMLRFLIKSKSPYEVLEESNENYSMHKRFNEINQKYQKILEKLKKIDISGKLLFFKYGGDMSMSSDIANELSYQNPEMFIIVAYVKGGKVNISGRNNNIRKYVLKAIAGLENARGGGHENAVGAQIQVNDLEKFKENLEREIL